MHIPLTFFCLTSLRPLLAAELKADPTSLTTPYSLLCDINDASFMAKPKQRLTTTSPADFNGNTVTAEGDGSLYIAQKGQGRKLATIDVTADDKEQQYLIQRARGLYIASICRPKASYDLAAAERPLACCHHPPDRSSAGARRLPGFWDLFQRLMVSRGLSCLTDWDLELRITDTGAVKTTDGFEMASFLAKPPYDDAKLVMAAARSLYDDGFWDRVQNGGICMQLVVDDSPHPMGTKMTYTLGDCYRSTKQMHSEEMEAQRLPNRALRAAVVMHPGNLARAEVRRGPRQVCQ